MNETNKTQELDGIRNGRFLQRWEGGERERGKHLNVRKMRRKDKSIQTQIANLVCVFALIRYGVCAYFHQ